MDETGMQILGLGAVGMDFMAMGTLIVNLDEVLLEYPVNFVFNQ
eukprot:SAG22_NODE_664_length_8022_cov_2.639576_7_plen_44_part_00